MVCASTRAQLMSGECAEISRCGLTSPEDADAAVEEGEIYMSDLICSAMKIFSSFHNPRILRNIRGSPWCWLQVCGRRTETEYGKPSAYEQFGKYRCAALAFGILFLHSLFVQPVGFLLRFRLLPRGSSSRVYTSTGCLLILSSPWRRDVLPGANGAGLPGAR
ncbi:hypothetical protein BX600DRAFT_277280 [Xylariales sp. PMI_506]|nr:hypothetical protein BX600DRAFT_277280 [Xylariales sp. PMI_506]